MTTTLPSNCCAFMSSSPLVPAVSAGPCSHRLVDEALVSIEIFRHTFVNFRHKVMRIGQLVASHRAVWLWRPGAWTRGDPDPFLTRFRIPRGVENQQDAFISFDAYARLLEASAEDLGCPDFGLRLSRWQGLHTLGPIAVIARNAQTLLGGVEAIARYLYVHSPALKLTLAPRNPRADLAFTYEVTEQGLADVVQTYEISMAIGVQIIRLLGGPEARPKLISFMHDQQGTDAAYRETLGCGCVSAKRGVDSISPRQLADRRIESADPETRRIAAKYLESNYLPRTASLSDRVAELTRQLLPTGQCSVDAIADHSRCIHGRCNDSAGHSRRAMSRRCRPGTTHPGGEIPRRTRAASQPDRGLARLHRTEHPQSLVPTLVREDTSPVSIRTATGRATTS